VKIRWKYFFYSKVTKLGITKKIGNGLCICINQINYHNSETWLKIDSEPSGIWMEFLLFTGAIPKWDCNIKASPQSSAFRQNYHRKPLGCHHLGFCLPVDSVSLLCLRCVFTFTIWVSIVRVSWFFLVIVNTFLGFWHSGPWACLASFSVKSFVAPTTMISNPNFAQALLNKV
jgi:hypothetical protein